MKNVKIMQAPVRYDEGKKKRWLVVDKNESYIKTCNGNTILIPEQVQTALLKWRMKKRKRGGPYNGGKLNLIEC